MRKLIVFLLILAGLASFSFIVISTKDINKSINDAKTGLIAKPEEPKFSTFTSAVCENKGEAVHCKDEVFVNCNGKVSKAEEITECSGIRFGMPKATGFAVFGKEWKDPRN